MMEALTAAVTLGFKDYPKILTSVFSIAFIVEYMEEQEMGAKISGFSLDIVRSKLKNAVKNALSKDAVMAKFKSHFYTKLCTKEGHCFLLYPRLVHRAAASRLTQEVSLHCR
ncbi:hypothetical protein WJX79_008481 [Trebouxia sp. C0005]